MGNCCAIINDKALDVVDLEEPVTPTTCAKVPSDLMSPTGVVCADSIVLRQDHFKFGGAYGGPVVRAGAEDFPFVMVTDMDSANLRLDTKGRKSWLAELQNGRVVKNSETGRWEVVWGELHELSRKTSDGKRGMELSDLCFFKNRLYTCDDRTGVVYEITGPRDQPDLRTWTQVKRKNNAKKGLKLEWSTVYPAANGQEFYFCGSHGDPAKKDGKVMRPSTCQIMACKPCMSDGSPLESDSTAPEAAKMYYIDGTSAYESLLDACGRFLGVGSDERPEGAFLNHECALYSRVRNKWLFFPRQVSMETFVPALGGRSGSNLCVACDVDIKLGAGEGTFDIRNSTVCEVGKVDKIRGFSAVDFVPGTNESVLVAVKSTEVQVEDGGDLVESHIIMFSLNEVATKAEIIMEDVRVPGNEKYEGFSFC